MKGSHRAPVRKVLWEIRKSLTIRTSQTQPWCCCCRSFVLLVVLYSHDWWLCPNPVMSLWLFDLLMLIGYKRLVSQQFSVVVSTFTGANTTIVVSIIISHCWSFIQTKTEWMRFCYHFWIQFVLLPCMDMWMHHVDNTTSCVFETACPCTSEDMFVEWCLSIKHLCCPCTMQYSTAFSESAVEQQELEEELGSEVHWALRTMLGTCAIWIGS